MDVTAALAVVGGGPAMDGGDPPDATNPAVAAAFTDVLTGLLTTPAPAPPVDGPDALAPTGVATVPPVSPLAPLDAPDAAVAVTPEVPVTVSSPIRDLTVAPRPGAGSTTPPGTQPGAPADPEELIGADLAAAITATVRRAVEAGEGLDLAPIEPPHRAGDPAPLAPAPTASLDDTARLTGEVVALPALASPLAGDHEPAADDDAASSGELRPDALPDLGATTPAVRSAVAAPAMLPTEAPGARALERALAAQVIARMGRVVDRGEGTHELSIELEPADLGRLELRVRLEAGVVHVHVDAHARATSDLLRRVLPELRDALTQSGLAPGALDIGDPRPQADLAGGPHQQNQRDRDHHLGQTPADPLGRPAILRRPVLSVRPGATRGVDVLL